MSPSSGVSREELHTRTHILIGVVYLFTAGATTVNRNVDFDYRKASLGALTYVFAEGAYHVRETVSIYQLRPEGRRWSHPDMIYHSIKAISGFCFFGAIFGFTELMSAVQVVGGMFALAGRSIFVPPS